MTENLKPDTLLCRVDAAKVLTEQSYKISPATLATKVTRGDGPPYVKFGGRPLYRYGDLMNWAESQLTEPRQRVA